MLAIPLFFQPAVR